jgi:oligoendopeptidase F
MNDCCSNKNDSKTNDADFKSLDGLICYCFKKTKKELFEAVKNGNENQVVDDIKSKMKDPGCFCETANPSGKCCLADIQSFIKLMK